MKTNLTRFEKFQHRATARMRSTLDYLEAKHPRIRKLLRSLAENRVIYTILTMAWLATWLTGIAFWWTYCASFLAYIVFVVAMGGKRIRGLGPLHILFIPHDWTIEGVESVASFLSQHNIAVSKILRCERERFRDRMLLPYGVFGEKRIVLSYLPDDFAEKAHDFWEQQLSEMRWDHETTLVFLGLSPQELEIQATNFPRRDKNFINHDFANDGLWVTITRRGRVTRLVTINSVLCGQSGATPDVPAAQSPR